MSAQREASIFCDAPISIKHLFLQTRESLATSHDRKKYLFIE